MQVWDRGTTVVKFWWEPSSWLQKATAQACPHAGEGVRALSEVPRIRALIPLMRTPASWPNLPKAPPPDTWGLGFSKHGRQTFRPEHSPKCSCAICCWIVTCSGKIFLNPRSNCSWFWDKGSSQSLPCLFPSSCGILRNQWNSMEGKWLADLRALIF